MCQAYEGEWEYLIARDKAEIRRKYEAYKRGELKLTDEELHKLTIEYMMLSE